ncbi:MAG: TatD family hydrolase, partial [Nanoarchaeota archaeon]|nr:TatD family hydrolase [Nanoarchaeota archaeon]
MKLVEKAIDLNYYFSIPAVIIRLEHFKKVVELLPTSKILTESDAPFLSPYQGKFNEPSFIKETIKEISTIKKLEQEEVEKIIYINFQKIFIK